MPHPSGDGWAAFDGGTDQIMTRPHTPFTHLQVHSHFTLLGATPSVDDLVARGTTDGLTHLALTDTNALYGAVAFSRACMAAGIQPLLGMTIRIGLPPNLTTLLPDRPAEDELGPDVLS